MAEINICCPFLLIANCADTDEHRHLFCEVAQEIQENSLISNERICSICVGEKYGECDYFKRFHELIGRMEIVRNQAS